jgi:hypothetical protein
MGTVIAFIIGGVAGVAALLVYQRAGREQLREQVQAAGGRAMRWPERAHELLDAARSWGRRYEVRITDEGEDRGAEMRFAWAVYDADWPLRAEAYADERPAAERGNPAQEDTRPRDPDGVRGKNQPYMLGNQPTLVEAVDQGLGWVMRQDPGATVVASARALNEAQPAEQTGAEGGA